MESKKRRMEIDTETLIVERRRDLAEERTAEPGGRYSRAGGGSKMESESRERKRERERPTRDARSNARDEL